MCKITTNKKSSKQEKMEINIETSENIFESPVNINKLVNANPNGNEINTVDKVKTPKKV